jgi:hypothetical protein
MWVLISLIFVGIPQWDLSDPVGNVLSSNIGMMMINMDG